MSLVRQTASSMGWMTLAMLASAALSALQLLVMGHYLSSAEVAAMGLMLILLSFVLMLFDIGISQAVIYRRDLSASEINGLQRVVAGLGILGALIILILRHPVAALLQTEILADMLLAVSFICLFFLPVQFRRSLVERDVAFKQVAGAEAVGALLGTSATIIALLCGVGAWSIGIGIGLNYGIQAAIIWGLPDQLDRKGVAPTYSELRQVLRFGLPHTGQRVLNFFVANVDFLLISAILGPAALGQYMLAYNIANLIASKFNPIAARVLYPMLNQVQQTPGRAARAICLIQDMLATAAGPPLLGLGVIAPLLIPLLLGERWQEAGILLQILAVVGYTRVIAGVTGPTILAFGRPEVGLRWSIVAMFLQAAAVYGGLLLYGTLGAAAAFAAMQILFLPLAWAMIYRPIVGLSLRVYLRSLAPGFALSVLTALAAWLALQIGIQPPPLSIALAIAAGGLTFAVLLLALRGKFVRDAIAMLKGPKVDDV